MLAGAAVSNIAWPHADLPRVLDVARELEFGGIEIAPYNVFGTWDIADADLGALRRQIEDAGFVIPALQGILYNVPDVALFESAASRDALARHLEKVARIAGLLGARACVFGAPRQRDPGSLPADAAWAIAVEFLQAIGRAYADHGTALAFEANARTYACRFITTTAQAIDLVEAVDTPGIAVQIDMGTIFIEGEDPSVLLRAGPVAAHAHVSEPGLQPVGSADIDHRPTAAALKESGYSGFLSIEMRAVDNWEAALRTAAASVKKNYL